jgi:hypothetical protein
MNKVLIIRVVVLAIIMIGSTTMSAMNEHQITFYELNDHAKDEVYDNCNPITQVSYRLTNHYNHDYQTERTIKKFGFDRLKQAYYTQNPSIALTDAYFPRLIFPQYGLLNERDWIVVDPRSEKFYDERPIKEFGQKSSEYLMLKTQKSLDEENSKQTEKHFHSRRPNPLLIAIAMGNQHHIVKEELSEGLGNYAPQAIGEAKRCAMYTKNLIAVRAIDEYEQQKFGEAKWNLLNSQLESRYFTIKSLIRKKAYSFNKDVLESAQDKEDDRLFKVIVSDGDYDVMAFGTPNDKENTLDNLKKMKEKGSCSQKHVDFYEKQLKDKKYRPQDMHCLIL